MVALLLSVLAVVALEGSKGQRRQMAELAAPQETLAAAQAERPVHRGRASMALLALQAGAPRPALLEGAAVGMLLARVEPLALGARPVVLAEVAVREPLVAVTAAQVLAAKSG